MPPHDPVGAGTDCTRRFNVFLFLERQCKASDETGVSHPPEHNDDEDNLPYPLPKHARQSYQQGKCRDRQHGICESHEDIVRPAAIVTRNKPNKASSECRADRRNEADKQRDAPSEEHTGKHVTTIVIGTQRVHTGSRIEEPTQTLDLSIWIGAPNEGTNEHEQQDKNQHERTDHGQLVTGQTVKHHANVCVVLRGLLLALLLSFDSFSAMMSS